MEELDEALVDFKRADHLMYVSLKYSRTHDVMMSLVDRLMATVDKCMNTLYVFKEIKEIPTAPLPKANRIKDEFPDDELINEMMDLFIKLRKVARSEMKTAGEFRRTLNTIVTFPDGEELILDIDTMQEYYNKTRDLIQHVRKLIGEAEDD